MAFGDVIRSAVGPAGTGFGALPRGMGGDASVIWITDASSGKIYKLDPSDFSTLLQNSAGYTLEKGAGGDVNFVISCGDSSIKKHSTVDLSVISTTASPGAFSRGIGGKNNVVWFTDNTPKVYELSTVDFSSIRNAASPGSYPGDIGGTSTRIWHVDYGGIDTLYELSKTDFSVIRSVAFISGSQGDGVGGNSNTIWACTASTDKVYELDAEVSEAIDVICGKFGKSIGASISGGISAGRHR